jgi:hypothetical protein
VFQRDPGLFREKLHRRREVDLLEFLDEIDRAAVGAAPEALVELAVGDDVEGRGLLVVEGTGSPVASALALQREVARNDFDDVDGVFDLEDALLGDVRQKAPFLARKSDRVLYAPIGIVQGLAGFSLGWLPDF